MGVQGLSKRLEGILWCLEWKDLQKTVSCNNEKTLKNRLEGMNSPPNQQKPRQRRRKLRVGMDISVWVARTCHACCVHLFVDERTTSNYERALMRLVSGKRNDDESENEADNKKEEEEFDLRLQEFVAKCAEHVLNQILTLKGGEGIDILVVLDGNTPPAKKSCSKERSDRRKEAGNSVTAIQKENQYQIEDVESRIQNCIRAARRSGGYFNSGSKRFLKENESIHAFQLVSTLLMKLLREEGIPFMVSPYESDSQLIYLAQKGYIDLVLTEDSDFYLTCPLVLTKLESSFTHEYDINRTNYSQQGDMQVKLLRHVDLGAVSGSFSLLDFSPLMFIILMVTAGCDYCKSLYGIGLVNARKIVKSAFSEYMEPGGGNKSILERTFQHIYQSCKGNDKKIYDCLSTNEKTNKFRIDYEKKFMSAIIMFRHAVVFCPVLRKNIFMKNPKRFKQDRDNILLCQYQPYYTLLSEELHDIVGEMYNPDKQIDIAEGVINPKTMKQYSLESRIKSISATSKKRKINDAENESHRMDSVTNSRISKNGQTLIEDTVRGGKEKKQKSTSNNDDQLPSQSSSTQLLSQAGSSNGHSSLSADVLSPNLLPSPNKSNSPIQKVSFDIKF